MKEGYRVAVIGCGGRSNMHIQAYKHISAGKVIACCDIVGAKADERAAEFDPPVDLFDKLKAALA